MLHFAHGSWEEFAMIRPAPTNISRTLGSQVGEFSMHNTSCDLISWYFFLSHRLTCSFIPDDAVLSELGSPDEFWGEQRALFCDGLKGVLTCLRAQKIRSFDLIAQAVVEHRAKFLGDKSKILPLEGISV